MVQGQAGVRDEKRLLGFCYRGDEGSSTDDSREKLEVLMLGDSDDFEMMGRLWNAFEHCLVAAD